MVACHTGCLTLVCPAASVVDVHVLISGRIAMHQGFVLIASASAIVITAGSLVRARDTLETGRPTDQAGEADRPVA